MGMAEVLKLAGQLRPAARAVEEAVELYEQKGNLVAATQARARLEGV